MKTPSKTVQIQITKAGNNLVFFFTIKEWNGLRVNRIGRKDV
jgi:hypothetical protein